MLTIPNFLNTRLVGAELLHADARTDGRDKSNSRFPHFSKAPKKNNICDLRLGELHILTSCHNSRSGSSEVGGGAKKPNVFHIFCEINAQYVKTFRRFLRIASSDYWYRYACPSVLLSVYIEQPGSHWTDFHEISYLKILGKPVKGRQFSFKSDKITGTLHDDVCAFASITHWVILKMRKLSDNICWENENAFLLKNFFPKIVSFMRLCKKYGKAKEATDDNKIWRMRFTCRINK
jgi:hypothetical protein